MTNETKYSFKYLIDEADVLLCLRNSLLHSPDIVDVLHHHVQLTVLGKLCHSLADLVQLHHDLLSFFKKLALTFLLGSFNELKGHKENIQITTNVDEIISIYDLHSVFQSFLDI